MHHKLLGVVVGLGLVGCVQLDESSRSQEVIAPPPAMSKLEAWFDADEGVTVRPDGEVYRWDDLSGHDYILGRAAETTPSITWSREYPGSEHRGVQFDPYSNDLGGYLVNGNLVLQPPFSVAMAFAPGVPRDRRMSDHVPFTGTTAPTVTIVERKEPGIGYPSYPPPPTIVSSMRATSGYQGGYTYIPGPWSERAHVVLAQFAGIHSRFSVDTPAGIHTATPLAEYPLTGVELSAGGRTFAGQIGAVLIYRDALTLEEEAEVMEYLAARRPPQ